MENFKNRSAFVINGFIAIFILAIIAGIFAFNADFNLTETIIWVLLAVSGISLFIISSGFMIINPNENAVLTFLGKYIGTVKSNGFVFTIPFTRKIKVSMKYINFNTGKIKVNDLKGNPVEIGAIVVWHVDDAALAVLNVDDYYSFVSYQSESALRTLVSKYPYYSDDSESLKSSMENITDTLKKELQERLKIAGIAIEEVRFSHLAYAPEVAASMLKRQQAEAVLDARKYLVENALLIVDDVIKHFKLDQNDDRALHLVNNLLVSLITESEVKPVLNVN